MLLSENLRDFCEMAIDYCDVDDCWLWKFATNKKGYARRTFGKTSLLMHRLMWIHFKNDGVIPDDPDLEVHHTCERKRCINPDHLTALTPIEHGQEHRSNYCQRGHDKRIVGVKPDGHCRECDRRVQRESARRRRS